MRRLIGALALCIFFVAPVVCDTPPIDREAIKKAFEAYERGDLESALAVYLPLAKQGRVPAQYLTGGIYRDQKNYTEALKWFSLAASNGQKGARFQIGKMYIYGWGVPQNYTEAHKLFMAAVDQEKCAYSMGFLGRMAYAGYVIPTSNITAHMWLNISSAHGDTASATFRDEVAKEMTTEEIMEAQRLALKWMAKNEKAQ